jgi:hypothetical protein
VEQQHVCALVGETAQKAGRRHDWATSGTLWWRGAPIDRLSDAYQALLNRAYEALFAQSDMFSAPLAATGEGRIAHTIGKSDPCDTILTTEEYARGLSAPTIQTFGLLRTIWIWNSLPRRLLLKHMSV